MMSQIVSRNNLHHPREDSLPVSSNDWSRSDVGCDDGAVIIFSVLLMPAINLPIIDVSGDEDEPERTVDKLRARGIKFSFNNNNNTHTAIWTHSFSICQFPDFFYMAVLVPFRSFQFRIEQFSVLIVYVLDLSGSLPANFPVQVIHRIICSRFTWYFTRSTGTIFMNTATPKLRLLSKMVCLSE